MINTVIGKLITLANAFKSFTELITGQKSSNSASGQISAIGSAAAGASAGMDDAASSADNLSSANNGVAKSAKKAAEKMRALWASTRSINWTVIHPATVQRQVLEAVWERLASAELELILEICPGEKLS